VSCDSTTVCTVRCLLGYALPDSMESASLVCFDGEWTGDTNVICEPIQCAIPNIEHANIDCPHGTRYNDRCTFTCKPTTIMIGTENEVICGENGLWSLPEAFCQATCPHEELLERNVSQETIVCKSTLPYATKELHPVSTICRMSCLRHYRVSQSSHSRLRLTCSEDGVWIGQACHPITCPPPKIVYVGLYNCSNGFAIG
uniref:Sushi domain-containing protein n=1 Tax=Parascaris univalens TaxID=6257 RepID=A0A915A7A2_PARUN